MVGARGSVEVPRVTCCTSRPQAPGSMLLPPSFIPQRRACCESLQVSKAGGRRASERTTRHLPGCSRSCCSCRFPSQLHLPSPRPTLPASFVPSRPPPRLGLQFQLQLQLQLLLHLHLHLHPHLHLRLQLRLLFFSSSLLPTIFPIHRLCSTPATSVLTIYPVNHGQSRLQLYGACSTARGRLPPT